MTACPDENTLARLAEGSLAVERLEELEAHLDGCDRCTTLLCELGRLVPIADSDGASIVAVDAGDDALAPARYRITRRLGAGAMGVVYAAEDRDLGRMVALKLVKTGDRDGDAPQRRARLLREARVLASVSHPNVITVHDVGLIGDQLYVALELISGTTVRAWQEAAPRSWPQLVAAYVLAGRGLAAAHEAGVVHRDVKPDNILIADDGRVVLVDFGLATSETPIATSTTLTQSGQVLGTPVYMAPEQLRGEAADARSDQFGLCASLWEALAHVRPFAGDTIAALAVAMTRPPTLPSRKSVPRGVFEILARGLASDPAMRWPSVDALLAALDHGRVSRKPNGPKIAKIVVAVTVVSGMLWMLLLGDPGGKPTDESGPRADPRDRGTIAVNDATSLVYSDPAACLTTLDRAGAMPPSWFAESESVRALCQMRLGDCVGGAERMTASLIMAAVEPEQIEKTVTRHLLAHCPIDKAGSAAERLERLAAQLPAAALLEDVAGCQQLLDVGEAMLRDVATEEGRVKTTYAAASCAVVVGDCARGEALWSRALPLVAGQHDRFVAAFPTCK